MSDASRAGEVKRVAGLDTIRFVCALWVVFGHLGFVPVPFELDKSTLPGLILRGMYGNAVSGPAAVTVFFVISGFCIHYPFRNGAPIPLKSYYSRRYARVLIPMAAAIALGLPLGINLGLLTDSILWSLVCEEIYYFIYPLLLRLRRAYGMKPLVGGAFVLALLVIALRDPYAKNYPSYGVTLNWVVGLPCWLLGCALAEADWGAPPRPREIWLLRGGVWLASSVCSGLRFHSPVGYPWTLNFFAVLAAYWLAREIANALNGPPSPLLERGGKWSYSLYLVHLHAAAIQARFEKPALAPFSHFFLTMGFTLGFAYAFYRIVEKPSHELARRIGQRLLRPAPVVVPVSSGP